MSGKVPTYAHDLEEIKRFFNEYREETTDGSAFNFKYTKQLQEIVNRSEDVLDIFLDDIEDFGMSDLKARVIMNTRRYAKLFAQAADDLCKDFNATVDNAPKSILDTYIDQRIALAMQNDENADPYSKYPSSLMRRYEVVFHPPSTMKKRSIRQVDAEDIGSLVSIEGIVTRATAVKPMMAVATYSCDTCGGEVFQEIASPTFMPLSQCMSDTCKTNKSRSKLTLQTRGSKFVKYQELKIQELSAHVPTGHIPRSMTVHVYGKNTRVAFPGDEVTISGIFLPVPQTGYRAIRAGLLSDTYLDAQYVHKKKKMYSEQIITQEMQQEIEEALEEGAYEQLAQSLAPEIFGHDDVKKALLLLLIGGVDRKMQDGMKIRGDINVCLMGDPGVAKSQLLKRVSELAPRSVYTTGRGSSGVGLTAAITRDPITNELILEGGALVMADMGVCCIDEFDKMEEGDRTAIHEVMEQQTISIAKAGITTTLNARAAILAAANPLYGRYDTRKSPTHNINLPAALLSRFDLLFLLVDRPNLENDLRLAKHITAVHMNNDIPDLEDDFVPLERSFIRNYITVAKTYQPYVGPELTRHITEVYAGLREGEADSVDDTHITARTLLATLRLSTALARLRFSDQVIREDFDEALRLMTCSKSSLEDAADNQVDKSKEGTLNSIYTIIRNHIRRNKTKTAFPMSEIRGLTAAYAEEDVMECVETYMDLNLWTLINGGNTLQIIS